MPQLRLFVLDTAAVHGGGAHGGDAVAATIAEHRGEHAVAAVVHGAPSVIRWRSACAAIARKAGLVVVGGGRTGGGTLLLSSLGVDADRVSTISFGSGRQRYLGPGATLAALRLLGSPFVLAGARLSGPDDAGRLRGAVDAFGSGRPPAVLAIRGSELDIADGIVVVDVSDVTGGVRLDLELRS